MRKKKYLLIPISLVAGAAFLISLFSGCAGGAANTPSPAYAGSGNGETPVPPEMNPIGDIPDSQVFVQYHSVQGGYLLDAPEGWARSTQGPDVNYVDKLDGVRVTVTQATTAPTAGSVQTNQVAALLKSGRAVQVAGVRDVQLPGGAGVLVDYSSNSDPDPVTGKQVRLENQMFLFFHNGHLASLTLWAPLGADNADQWWRISHSFKWS